MSTVEEVKKILREEMDARGWHNNDWRAGLAAIVGGESGFIPKAETGYSHTSNTRIRRIFSKARNLSDSELDRIKSTDRSWFNFVYGGRLGNRPGTDDGYTYRGRGLIQLTFRGNYEIYAPKVGVDIVEHPELAETPRVAAAIAVEYMKTRFRGGDFAAMKAAVGISIGEPDDEKNRLYDYYSRTGEWNYSKPIEPEPEPEIPNVEDLGEIDPIIDEFLTHLQRAEYFLKDRGLYTGPIDLDPGPGLRAALKAYLAGG